MGALGQIGRAHRTAFALIAALRIVRDEASNRIVDQCPRHESEPFISIWEDANTSLRKLNAFEPGK